MHIVIGVHSHSASDSILHQICIPHQCLHLLHVTAGWFVMGSDCIFLGIVRWSGSHSFITRIHCLSLGFITTTSWRASFCFFSALHSSTSSLALLAFFGIFCPLVDHVPCLKLAAFFRCQLADRILGFIDDVLLQLAIV